jgi:raffinose synthase
MMTAVTNGRGLDFFVAIALLLSTASFQSSTAFVPQATNRKLQGRQQTAVVGSAESRLYVATEPRVLTTGNGGDDPDDDQDADFLLERLLKESLEAPSTDRRRLQLNPDGKLRLGRNGPVVLDGLSASTWTGIEPSAADYSVDPTATSMFLKATHSAKRSEHELTLGTLVSCHRLMACARVNRYWMGPKFGTSAKDIPLDTQFLLVELAENGPYALILPLVDAGFRATVQASDDKSLEVVCFSESGDKSVVTDGMLALHVSVGDDPFALLKQGFQQVADGLGTFQTLDRKLLPPSVDYFGWCTWDAFYSKVTPEGVLEGVKALKDAGVPPRNLILDDGWQEVGPYPKDWTDQEGSTSQASTSWFSSITGPIVDMVAQKATDYYTAKVQRAAYGSMHNRIWTTLAKTVLKKGLWDFFDSQTDFARQLNGFEPNFKFEKQEDGLQSNGVSSLKEMVTKLKTELDVKHVYCWHALHGYWRGVSTELGNKIGIDVLQVYPKASKHVLQLDPLAEFDPPSLFGVGMITKEDDLQKFYEHIHAPLVEAGVDGVKVDVQSGVTAAGSGVGGGSHIARLYTQAMEESVSKNFASKENGAVNTINCMCHSTENLYRYQVTSVARASEDFFPSKPESHSVHLVNVAYNSLFLGEICLPDWDMFHSKHASAELHAAARSIGGCPVYVSDVPGQHNTTLLKRLVLPDGSILRAQLPGRPTRDCLFADVGQDGTSALKIWNQNKAGTGVIGTFHVQGVAWNFDTHENEVLESSPAPITAVVKPFDVETLRGHNAAFAVWGHKAGSLQVLDNGDEQVETPLDHSDWEIFTVAPIQTTDSVQWAPIGLGDMMNSGGALEVAGPLEQTLVKEDSSFRQSTTVGITSRGPGRFVAYCQPAPSSIMINDGRASIPSTISFSHDSETGLLEFDLPKEAADKQPHQLTVVWDENAN